MNSIDFSALNLGVDGDSITAGEQWSYHVFKDLGFKTHHNVAVGSSCWYKRRHFYGNGSYIETQDFDSPDFAGISDGWEDTDDLDEIQKRLNNCAVVHIQKFLSEVKSGSYPAPDVFVFAMGTNDDEKFFGDSKRTAYQSEKPSGDELFTESGAVRWCIQTIAEEYPEARIFVCTPIQTGRPEHNRKNRKIIENLKIICSAMSVQLIDCYSGSGICEKFEKEDGTGRYLKDGLHPDTAGQTLEGKFIGKEIRNNIF